MQKDISQAKRGMAFEKRIQKCNEDYEKRNVATIQKIPTPTLNIRGRIVYSESSTVDFMGMINSQHEAFEVHEAVPIAFEAKETTGAKKPDGSRRLESSFPLVRGGIKAKDLVTRKQREFLLKWENGGGMCFVLIHFAIRDECFMVPIRSIIKYYQRIEEGGRKSIPYEEFRDEWKVEPYNYLGL